MNLAYLWEKYTAENSWNSYSVESYILNWFAYESYGCNFSPKYPMLHCDCCYFSVIAIFPYVFDHKVWMSQCPIYLTNKNAQKTTTKEILIDLECRFILNGISFGGIMYFHCVAKNVSQFGGESMPVWYIVLSLFAITFFQSEIYL